LPSPEFNEVRLLALRRGAVPRMIWNFVGPRNGFLWRKLAGAHRAGPAPSRFLPIGHGMVRPVALVPYDLVRRLSYVLPVTAELAREVTTGLRRSRSIETSTTANRTWRRRLSLR
jgi:hypothetical protein